MPNATSTHYPPWTLHAWPPVLWQLGRMPPLQMRHLGTHVTQPGDADRLPTGQTMWIAEDDAGELGLAWDWVHIGRGVVAMADPMAVVSNLRLLDGGGEVLDPLTSALHFNGIVHALPWQAEVQRALSMQDALQ